MAVFILRPKEFMMGLKPSSEMYLETIYILTKSKPFVRSIDIAEHMNYSRPSVSRGIGILKKAKYIVVDTDGYISLTDRGLLLAEKIYERHTVLSKILMMLGVDEKTAIEDACKAEHVISDRSFQALKKHAEDKQRSEKDRS
jgi:DtxR family Mn-dependent transcriptional regulator